MLQGSKNRRSLHGKVLDLDGEELLPSSRAAAEKGQTRQVDHIES